MCYSLWYNESTMLPAGSLDAGEQCHTGLLTACEQEQMPAKSCFIPQAVTHSLALLRMGVIIARNMLS